MLFNSLEFFAFLFVVLAVQAALPARPRKAFLLLASYVFYGAWDWRFLGLIWLSTAVDFVVGGAIGKTSDAGRRRALVVTSLVVNLSLLGYFKYAGFFVDSFVALLESAGFSPAPYSLDIVLPVGISFYTFQTLSYTIDVYRGRLAPSRSLLDFALFVAFFPQLVAGPIERASHFLPQIVRSPRPSGDEVASGSWLVLWGIFKKVVIADNLALLVNAVYAPRSAPTGPEVWLATYAFAVQIYCDFSGYTDVARGVARILGYDLMVNFRVPYVATDPADFWRRWHISLSTWLRDYLYIPLGGNRNGTSRTYRNLFLTMLLGGLWHGAAWTYVLWGAYHGALLGVHRAFRSLRQDSTAVTSGISYSVPSGVSWRTSAVWLWLRRLWMFHLVCLGWLVFRADSLSQVESLLARAVGDAQWGNAAGWLLPFAVLVGPLLVYEIAQHRSDSLEPLSRCSVTARVAASVAVIIVIALLGESVSAPFIYFQF